MERERDLARDRLDEHPLALAERRLPLDTQRRLLAAQPRRLRDLDLDRVRAERPLHLLARDPHDLAGVELAADLARDLRHELLAPERVDERVGRAHALERERRLGRERLEQRDLVGSERALLARRRDDEHADDALLGDHREPTCRSCAPTRCASRGLITGEPSTS